MINNNDNYLTTTLLYIAGENAYIQKWRPASLIGVDLKKSSNAPNDNQ